LPIGIRRRYGADALLEFLRENKVETRVSEDGALCSKTVPSIDALQDALDRATLHTDLSSITACSAAFGTMRWTSPT
jgi:hypothetical protein